MKNWTLCNQTSKKTRKKGTQFSWKFSQINWYGLCVSLPCPHFVLGSLAAHRGTTAELVGLQMIASDPVKVILRWHLCSKHACALSDRDGYRDNVCNISHHPLLLENFSCPSHQSSGNSLTLMLFSVLMISHILKILINRWDYKAEIIYEYVCVSFHMHTFIYLSDTQILSRCMLYLINIYLFICAWVCMPTICVWYHRIQKL